MASKRNRRIKLFKENPLCPFCGVKMVLPEDTGQEPRFMKNPPDNLCTIEHLYTRYNPKRFENRTEEPFTIICCRKCNMIRGKEEELKHGQNIKRIDRHNSQKKLKDIISNKYDSNG